MASRVHELTGEVFRGDCWPGTQHTRRTHEKGARTPSRLADEKRFPMHILVVKDARWRSAPKGVDEGGRYQLEGRNSHSAHRRPITFPHSVQYIISRPRRWHLITGWNWFESEGGRCSTGWRRRLLTPAAPVSTGGGHGRRLPRLPRPPLPNQISDRTSTPAAMLERRSRILRRPCDTG